MPIAVKYMIIRFMIVLGQCWWKRTFCNFNFYHLRLGWVKLGYWMPSSCMSIGYKMWINDTKLTIFLLQVNQFAMTWHIYMPTGKIHKLTPSSSNIIYTLLELTVAIRGHQDRMNFVLHEIYTGRLLYQIHIIQNIIARILWWTYNTSLNSIIST